jgi:two-component sensor histidine kinase
MTEAPQSSAAQLRLLSGVLAELARAVTYEDVMQVAVLALHRACGANGLVVQMGGSDAVHFAVTDGLATPSPAPSVVADACAEALKGLGTRITSITPELQGKATPQPAATSPSASDGPRDVVSTSVGASDEPQAGVAAYWLEPQTLNADEIATFEGIANATALAMERVFAVSPGRADNGRGSGLPNRDMTVATPRFYEFQRQVRGLLASIRSIVRRTARRATSLDDYAAHLEGRLGALARIQGFLVRVPDNGVDLEELVWSEFLAQSITQDQANVAGPPVRLSPKAAESLGLAMHELMMNSIKYGGLSHAAGRVTVTWSADERRPGCVRMRWSETAPRVPAQAITRRGFGLELIEKTLPYELGAQTAVGLAPGGLSCTISFPPDAVGQRERA